jgi:hypothetical protein
MEVKRVEVVDAVVTVVASKHDEVIFPDRASVKRSLARDDCASGLDPFPDARCSMRTEVARFFSTKI